MDYEYIQFEHEENLAVITINREKSLNALSTDVVAELTTVIAELELDDDAPVIALTGAGSKAFVAGADIAEMRDMEPRDALAFSEIGANLCEAIETSTKPYIAAVNGFALGGGCELALACDFIYASTTAKLGQPEVKLGIIPGFGGTQRLLRRVGIAKARELVFTGATIGAEEALRIGLVDLVVAPDELMDRVRATAAAIAGNGPLAVAEAKRVMHAGQSMGLEASILLEGRSFAGLFSTADQKEGMDAFVAKRKAEFRGR